MALWLPVTLHILFFFSLAALGKWCTPAGMSHFDAIITSGSITLLFFFPVTIGIFLVSLGFGYLQLITAFRIAPDFPSPWKQLLVGILNPSLGILATIVFFVGYSLLRISP